MDQSTFNIQQTVQENNGGKQVGVDIQGNIYEGNKDSNNIETERSLKVDSNNTITAKKDNAVLAASSSGSSGNLRNTLIQKTGKLVNCGEVIGVRQGSNTFRKNKNSNNSKSKEQETHNSHNNTSSSDGRNMVGHLQTDQGQNSHTLSTILKSGFFIALGAAVMYWYLTLTKGELSPAPST